jgi:putative ABC transport system ATP-binding protein
VNRYGQTTLMVTHDPHAAAIADRVVFIDDGVIAGDLDGDFGQPEVVSAMEGVSSR